jgi:hypothetical protein
MASISSCGEAESNFWVYALEDVGTMPCYSADRTPFYAREHTSTDKREDLEVKGAFQVVQEHWCGISRDR